MTAHLPTGSSLDELLEQRYEHDLDEFLDEELEGNDETFGASTQDLGASRSLVKLTLKTRILIFLEVQSWILLPKQLLFLSKQMRQLYASVYTIYTYRTRSPGFLLLLNKNSYSTLGCQEWVNQLDLS